MKKIILFFTAILLIGIVNLVFFFIFLNDDISVRYKNSFLPSNNVYVLGDASLISLELENLENDSDALPVFIFYASPEASFCNDAIRILDNIAKANNVSKIIYVEASSVIDLVEAQKLSDLEAKYGFELSVYPFLVRFDNINGEIKVKSWNNYSGTYREVYEKIILNKDIEK